MKLILGLLLLLSSWGAQARVLFVSDVDDTVKLSHVINLRAAAIYALDDESRFVGMSELYGFVAQDTQAEIAYLSNAPTWLMKNQHLDFLANGRFPEGEYIGRSQHSSSTHKLIELRRLIEHSNPSDVILIGDNGERDSVIYDQIANEYSRFGVRFHQFIRRAYDHGALKAGQIGFVTPVELALELESRGFISERSVSTLVEKVVPQVLQERGRPIWGVVAFPRYVNCKGFVWQWDVESDRFPSILKLKERIQKICK